MQQKFSFINKLFTVSRPYSYIILFNHIKLPHRWNWKCARRVKTVVREYKFNVFRADKPPICFVSTAALNWPAILYNSIKYYKD